MNLESDFLIEKVQLVVQLFRKYRFKKVIFLEEKIMKSSIRKTRSDKFPLTLHPSGQYCKKIKGHIYYFGSDKKHALESYLDQAIFLHGYNSTQQKNSKWKHDLERNLRYVYEVSAYKITSRQSYCASP